MEDYINLIKTLYVKATDYGKTSLELTKLKAVDISSDVVSAMVFKTIFLLFIATFLLFLNLGIAIWLGEEFGKLYYGFFVVAGFYILTGFIVRFFMKKTLKRRIRDYFIRTILN